MVGYGLLHLPLTNGQRRRGGKLCKPQVWLKQLTPALITVVLFRVS